MLTQTVDIFPTIVEAALGETVPECPEDSSKIAECTEGVSMLPLIDEPDQPAAP